MIEHMRNDTKTARFAFGAMEPCVTLLQSCESRKIKTLNINTIISRFLNIYTALLLEKNIQIREASLAWLDVYSNNFDLLILIMEYLHVYLYVL